MELLPQGNNPSSEIVFWQTWQKVHPHKQVETRRYKLTFRTNRVGELGWVRERNKPPLQDSSFPCSNHALNTIFGILPLLLDYFFPHAEGFGVSMCLGTLFGTSFTHMIVCTLKA